MADSDFVYLNGEPIDVGNAVENDFVFAGDQLVSDGDVSDFAFIGGRGIGAEISADLVAAGLAETATALAPDDGSDLWTTGDLTPNVQQDVTAMRVGPNENVVYAGASDSLIALDAGDGSEAWRTGGLGTQINALTAPADGSVIYLGSRDGEVRAVDAAGTEQWVYTGAFSSDASVSDVAVTSDGATVFGGSELIFSGSGGDTLAAIDTATQTANWDVAQYPDGVSAVGVSPDDQTVYAATENGEFLRAHDASDGSEIWTFSGYADFYGPNSLVVAPDGTIYSGDGQGDVFAVDPAGNQLWSQTVGIGTIAGLSVSPDSSTVFTSSQDFGAGQIAATDAETGTTTQWSRSYGVQPDSISTVGEYN